MYVHTKTHKYAYPYSSLSDKISINANIFEKLKVQIFVAGRKSAEMCWETGCSQGTKREAESTTFSCGI